MILLSAIDLGAYDRADIDSMNDRAFELRRTDLDSFHAISKRALSLSDSMGYDRGKAYAYRNLGVIYWIKGNYARANELSYKSLKIFESIGDKEGILRVLNNIALIHIAQDNFEESIDLLRQSRKLSEETGNLQMQAMTNMNLGIAHGCLFDYEKAKSHYFEAIDLFQSIDRMQCVADVNAYLGKLYMSLEKYDSSKYFLDKSLKCYVANENIRGEVMASNYLAQCLDRQGKIDETIRLARKAFVEAKANDLLYDMFDLSRLLAKNYAAKKDFAKGYEFSEISHRLGDSLRNESHAKEITKLSLEYQFNKKMSEIEHEQKQKQMQHESEVWLREQILFLIAIGLLFAIGFIVIIHINYKKKIQLNEELKARNDEILCQKEKLEELNHRYEKLMETKDKFFSIVAHDLMSPLAAFRDVTEYIDNENEKMPEKDKQEFISAMKKSAYNMVMLLSNLLTWARTQQGNIKFHPEKTDLTAMVEDNVKLLESIAERKLLTIVVQMENEVVAKVDRDMIRTVIRSLLKNAISHSQESGKIEINGVSRNGQVEIHVVDEGNGIEEHLLKCLFKIEKTNEVREAGTGEGTGLGLIISKEFVDRHKGTIGVNSIVGVGSDFYFTIPTNI
jgi:two-component system sensor histidine kinase/response regulator